MRRFVDFVRQAFSKQRKSPERPPRLVQGTSIAAAAQRIIERTILFSHGMDVLAELSRELPLLDSTELDEAQLAPTRDIIREFRDIGEEIDAYSKAYIGMFTLDSRGKRKRDKRLFNAVRRQGREVNKRLWTLFARLRAQEPM